MWAKILPPHRQSLLHFLSFFLSNFAKPNKKMQKSKLIDTIGCLHADELTRLEQFLVSPLFQKDALEPAVLALFKYIVAHWGPPEHPELDRDRVYQCLFPDAPLVKGRLEKVMTRLLKEVRRLIVFDQQQRHLKEAEENRLLTQFFLERQHFDEFDRNLHHARAALNGQEIKDSTYFWNWYQLEYTYSQYLTWFNDRKTDLNTEPALLALNAHYVSIQLDFLILHLSQSRVVPLEPGTQLPDASFIEALVQKLPMAQFLTLQVQYAAYRFLSAQPASPNMFMEFTRLLETHETALNDEKLKDYLALARNYCIGQFNRGNEAFFKIAFDMYKLHLEKGYLYRNGLLHGSVLKNIVSMSLRMGEQAWAVSFLEAHRDKITGNSAPEEVYRFNLAMCYFYARNFEEVLSIMSFNYDDLFYKIAAKRLEIKALFELQSTILDSRLEAFNILIFRMSGKQLSEVYINGNKRFVAYLRRILNPGTLHNPKRRDKIRQEMLNETVVVEKEWLLDILSRNTK